MDFDFCQLYKDYSNIELLKIIKSPLHYQPEAIEVATKILNNRHVTNEEEQIVEQYFDDIDKTAKAKREKIELLKDKATDFLEPVLHPSEKVEPKKWINIFLLVVAVQYAFFLFNSVQYAIFFIKCDYCSIDITFFGQLFTLFYVPLIFFLLYKRRRWGWILLFADNIFSLLSRVAQSYMFFKYQSIHHGDTASFLLIIFVKALFVFFLWRDVIASYFGVTQETKKKTTFISIGGTLVFNLIMYLMYG
jgi:hypothetical protein